MYLASSASCCSLWVRNGSSKEMIRIKSQEELWRWPFLSMTRTDRKPRVSSGCRGSRHSRDCQHINGAFEKKTRESLKVPKHSGKFHLPSWTHSPSKTAIRGDPKEIFLWDGLLNLPRAWPTFPEKDSQALPQIWSCFIIERTSSVPGKASIRAD